MSLLTKQFQALGRADLIPETLLREQPQLAAYIGKNWGRAELAQIIFDLLLSDRERINQGMPDFSPEVVVELMRISVIYPDLLPQILSTQDVWGNVREKHDAIAELPMGYANKDTVNTESATYTMPGYLDSPPSVMPKMRQDSEWTSLMQASFAGRVEQVKSLLAKKTNALQVDRDGYQALHLAAIQGELAIVHLLLDYGVDADVVSLRHASPLLLAAARGHEAVVEALLGAGASVDLARDDGWTALHKAVANGHDALVLILLEAGANPLLTVKTGHNALALVPENKERMAQLLLSYDAKPRQMQVLASREVVSQPHIDWS